VHCKDVSTYATASVRCPNLLAPLPPPLACRLQSGEHVKVVHGQQEGETGMVVRVEGSVCYIFTDTTQQELRVFTRDLTLAVATSSAVDS
jgi:transcription elongation factor